MEKWEPTDMLKTGKSQLQVKRFRKMGTGNGNKGTENGVVYWHVETSPRYGSRTGIHSITMVPETRLTPIQRKQP